jgi:hypothetical protein
VPPSGGTPGVGGGGLSSDSDTPPSISSLELGEGISGELPVPASGHPSAHKLRRHRPGNRPAEAGTDGLHGPNRRGKRCALDLVPPSVPPKRATSSSAWASKPIAYGAGCGDRTRHLMITNRSRTVRLVSTCAVSCALIRHDAISRADWCCLVSASVDSFVGNPWARSRSCGTLNRRRSTAPEYPSLRAGRGSPRHHHGARRRPHCWCETWDRDPSPGGDG